MAFINVTVDFDGSARVAALPLHNHICASAVLKLSKEVRAFIRMKLKEGVKDRVIYTQARELYRNEADRVTWRAISRESESCRWMHQRPAVQDRFNHPSFFLP